MNEVIERTELLIPGPAQALGALLDVPVPDLEKGEGLPITWHWLYLSSGRPRPTWDQTATPSAARSRHHQGLADAGCGREAASGHWHHCGAWNGPPVVRACSPLRRSKAAPDGWPSSP